MKYIATAVVTLAAGAEVGLNKDQAAARCHCTTPSADRKGWYLVTGPLQFKVGESFLYEGELPKALADAVEPAKKGPSKAEQEAAAKAAQALESARSAVKSAENAVELAKGEELPLAAATAQLEQARAALAALGS
jgi:hypothetical protein